MSPEPQASYSERVVVAAATSRDGEVTCRILESACVSCLVVRESSALDVLVGEGIGALVVTDLMFSAEFVADLLAAVDRQPAWSNLPVLVLCPDGARAPEVERVLQALRNVTVLDRPTSGQALRSAVESALRGRRWQYQIRDQIMELTRADRALREADQRKDEFLATLAHELRNPLAPIQTGLDVMVRVPPGSEPSLRVAGMMQRQLSHLVRLVDELLEVSRIATGKISLQRAHIDLRRALATAIEGCQPLLDRAGHQLVLRQPDHAVIVFGDETRLAQSFSNLINNACKYSAPGGRVEVTLAVQDQSAVVSVADQGMGIPADMLERVFDLFTQLRTTLHSAQGGLGIGLSLVRSLAALHHGEVHASSEGPGRGSTFTLRLPLSSAADREAADKPAPGAGAPASLQRMRRRRILVVDDNTDAAESLGALLSVAGHEVRIDYNGHDALRTAGSFMPHAVLCDVGMPGMNGLELASRLRQDQRFASTLLVALTGWGGDEDKRRTREAGFDAHLTKPASQRSLSQVLAAL
jgi:signal transduction histidine kinase/CheY-like chemotaxis protein